MITKKLKKILPFLSIAFIFIILFSACCSPFIVLYYDAEEKESTVYITDVSRQVLSSDKAIAYGICDNEFVSFHIDPNTYLKFTSGEYPLETEYIINGKYSDILNVFDGTVSVTTVQ